MTSTVISSPRTAPPEGNDALTDLIVRLSGAQGCGLYVARSGSHALVRQLASGVCLPDVEELQSFDLDRLTQRPDLAVLPLYTGGLVSAVLLLAFVPGAGNLSRGALNRLVPLLGMLVRFVNTRDAQIRLATKISDLEAEIASEKILERVSGLIQEQGTLDASAIDLVERHITKVLSSCEFGQALEERLRELESRAAERDRTFRAKLLLQKHLGLTEQQAYQLLRTDSRRQRKRIGDVAEEVIARYTPAQAEPSVFE